MPDALLGSIWSDLFVPDVSLVEKGPPLAPRLRLPRRGAAARRQARARPAEHPRPGGPLARVQRAAERRVLLEHGQVLRDALRREAITIEELRSAALERGFERLDDIELIVLEPNGHLAIMGHEAARHWRQRRAGEGRRSDR